MESTPPRPPRVCFYGDDFTGAADNLAQYHREGLKALMFFGNPAPGLLARHAHELDVLGVAGVARSLPTSRMDAEIRPALETFRRLESPVVQYKVCSTFDSSPQFGSFGRVIDIGRELFGPHPVPVVAGCPDFGRYTLFGNHFAQFRGNVHRLDRHPTMSRHPSTPMHEADLPRHLAQQTPLPVALVDIVAMKSDAAAFRDAHARAMAQDPGAVVFDVLDNADLDRAAATIWESGARRPVFTLSAQGLASGLARELARRGLGDPAKSAGVPLEPVDRLLVLSGSCSPQTASQIGRARAEGWATIALDVPSILDAKQEEHAFHAALARAREALASGRSAVVYTAEGPDDPAIAAARDALARRALPGEALAEAIGRTFGRLLTALMNELDLPRFVLAGGDTSSHTMRTMDAYALEVDCSNFAINSHVCRLFSDNPRIAGTQVLLKGGQGGDDDLFLTVRSAAGWN